MGVAWSVRSLFEGSVQRALGLKRPFRFKIVPILSAVIAYLPAIVFIGVAFLFSELLEFQEEATGETELPTYSGYYSFITAAILLFVAFITPEVTVTDRRTGMLGMYLAAPLTRSSYLLGKIASVFVTLLVVTIGPVLLVLVGFVAAEIGPDGIGGFLAALARIVIAGVLVSAYLSLIHI